MSETRGWDKAKQRWVKMIDGKRYRVTCTELGLPKHLWTREGSAKAAKEWFTRLAEKMVVARYASHPELHPVAAAADTLKADGKDAADLERHLEEAASRPSGATRNETTLEYERRKALEELLEVDLGHVPQLTLEKFLVERELTRRVPKPKAADPNRALGHLVDVYIRQRLDTEAKGLKEVTTVEFDRYNLKRLREFLGESFGVENLKEYDHWHRWGEYCQSYAAGKWSNKTARSTRTGVRSFVAWLVMSGRLASLPPNFNDYKIKKKTKQPVVFTDDELKRIVSAADDELKAYILLALNTGANQIDIATLRYAGDEEALGLRGRQIKRKRVKTEDHAEVPVVRYILWDRTAELVEEFMAEGEMVFRNSTGGLLVHRHRNKEDGKYKNNDSLGKRFIRLVQGLGIAKKTFKTLRATSASKLGNKKEYRVYGPLFLGHAPDGVYESHYLKEDCKELNEAVAWLEGALLGE